MAEYRKLVRDKIPGIILNNGEQPMIRRLEDREFKQELLKKLIEEAIELMETPNIEERADVEEVLRFIDEQFGFTPEEIEINRLKKAGDRGVFEDRIFLEKTV